MSEVDFWWLWCCVDDRCDVGAWLLTVIFGVLVARFAGRFELLKDGAKGTNFMIRTFLVLLLVMYNTVTRITIFVKACKRPPFTLSL